MATITGRVYGLAREVADGLGFELEDVELLGSGRRQILRVTIDRPGGVTLDDCEAFSRDFEAILDVEDPIAGPYTLEVSSPGLDRPLKKPVDFEKSVGKLVRVVTRDKVHGRSFLLGRLREVRGDRIRLLLGEEEVEVPFENIKRARLEVEI